MTESEKILEKLPSVKIGLDDHYGKQTVLNALNQALSMSGVSDSVPCDYRNAECTNQGRIIDGVWRCSNHQGTDH